MLEQILAADLPFASSVSGYIILVVMALIFLVQVAMCFGIAYLSMRNAETEKHMKHVITEAMDTWAKEHTK